MTNEAITTLLAKNIASVSYDDIPAEAVRVTKDCILDTLGVTVAGATLGDGSKEIVELVKEWGGKQESTIVGFGGKVPCLMAAFANGAMSHALDYDDVLDTGFLHMGDTTVPSAFAISERLGKVTGKELITAVTLGCDLICRLGHSVTQGPGEWRPRWMMTAVLGVFSSAATCSKLLKLGKGGIASAFGIALNQAGGTFEMAFSPTYNKVRAIYAGFPAEAGLKAALLAQKGITAPETSLEGTTGLYNMYFDGKYDPAVVLDQLGRRFENTKISFKPWPSCRLGHTYIDATLELVQEHDVQPEDVKNVTVHVGDSTQALCQPLEERRHPPTSMAAKFSIPFALAAAIAYRKVTLYHFTGEGIKDERILQLADRISPQYDPRLNRSTGMPPARVEIETNGGKIYSQEADVSYGSPQKPMTTDQLIEKFDDCVSYAPKPDIRNRGKEVVAMVNRLEEVDDVAQLIELLG